MVVVAALVVAVAVVMMMMMMMMLMMISDKCTYRDGKQYSTGDTWSDGCSLNCKCEDGSQNKYSCTER